MNENTKKVLGIGGAIAVVVGTVGMILSGADTTAVSGKEVLSPRHTFV